MVTTILEVKAMDYDNENYLIPKILLQDDFYSNLSARDILVYAVLKDRQIEAPEKRLDRY